MDIDFVEKAIKASLEETLKRTRRADEELKKAQTAIPTNLRVLFTVRPRRGVPRTSS
jgi:hypothetical protein